jgi:hypothetical protein
MLLLGVKIIKAQKNIIDVLIIVKINDVISFCSLKNITLKKVL